MLYAGLLAYFRDYHNVATGSDIQQSTERCQPTSYEDEVLEVSLPKAAEVKPKKISVSAKKKASK